MKHSKIDTFFILKTEYLEKLILFRILNFLNVYGNLLMQRFDKRQNLLVS